MKFNQQFSSKFRILSKGRVVLAISVIAANILHASPEVNALPTNPNIVSGNININAPSSNTLNINQASNKGIINWGSFNIGSAATVNFKQPNVNSSTLNRVVGGGLSQIAGNLNANGNVILINPNGVVFQNGSRVDVGSITATTMNLKDEDFLNDKLNFTRDGNIGKVINKGTITAKDKGYVALLAPEVQSDGVIKAVQGSVAFASGDAITLDLDGDGLLNVEVEAATIDTLIENKGLVQAEGGLVYMSSKAATDAYASTVSNSGKVSASSMEEVGGKIVFLGTDITNSGTLEAKGKTGGGEILVGGDWQGANNEIYHEATTVTATKDSIIDASAVENGDGGKVVLWSDIKDKNSITSVKGTINAKGGEVSGDGGEIETSGYILDVNGINLSASSSKGKGGEWLLDPNNITINDTGTTTAGSTSLPSYTSNTDSTVIDKDDIETQLNAGTSVTIQTGNSGSQSGDITLANSIITGAMSGDATLTLKAHRDIIINSGVSIDASQNSNANKLNIVLHSDSDGSYISGGASSSAGSIEVNSGATLKSNGGDITLGGGSDISTGYALATGIGGSYIGIELDNVTIDSSNGNITMRGMGKHSAEASVGVLLGAGTSINSGLGKINIIGDSQGFIDSTSGYRNGIRIDGSSGNLVTLLSTSIANDAITLTGHEGYWRNTVDASGGSGNDREGLSLNYTDITSSGGVIFAADKQYYNNTTLTTSGVSDSLTISSYKYNSFWDTFNWNGTLSGSNFVGSESITGLTINDMANLNGLTIGKTANTTATNLKSNINIAGDINIYGKDITISENLDTSSVSDGDILLKATDNITIAASKSILTDGGDITLWSNSDSDGGYIYIQDGITIDTRTASDRTANNGTSDDTNGGAITLGGGAGTTTPTGYALQNTTSTTLAGIMLGTNSGSSHDSNIAIYSGGGNISLKGKATNSSNSSEMSGIYSHSGMKLDSGSNGNIFFDGLASNDSITSVRGITLLGTTSDNLYLRSKDGDITLNGVVSLNPSEAYGVRLEGHGAGVSENFIEATGTGDVSITGSVAGGQNTSQDFHIRAVSVLSNSGNIIISGTSSTIHQVGHIEWARIGSNIYTETNGDANLVTSSNSNISILHDKLNFAGTVSIKTDGTLTLASANDDFGSAFTTPSSLSIENSVTGLTIGKSATSSDGTDDIAVTISNAIDISGDINIYGKDININNTIDTSGDLLLKASRHNKITSGITASSGKFWADSDKDGDGINMITASNITTTSGNLEFGNGDTYNSEFLVGGDVYFNSSLAQTLSTNGGDLIVHGETLLANPNGLSINTLGGDITFDASINSANQYNYVSGWKTWEDARTDALNKNGDTDTNDVGDSYLVSIGSRLENAVAGITTGYVGAWIGAYRDKDDVNGNGDTAWYWADSPDNTTPFLYQSGADTGLYNNFANNEPNGSGTSGEYAGQFFGTAGEWNDLVPNSNQGDPYSINGYVKETNLASSNITIDSGAGNITFTGDIGTSKEIGTLNITSSSDVILPSNITTENIQTYNANVKLANDTTLTTTNSDIIFNGTVDSLDALSPKNLTTDILADTTYYWVDWTSANAEKTQVDGTITIGSKVINVTFQKDDGFFGSQTSTGTNYWTGRNGAAFSGTSPYLSSSVANGPNSTDIIQLSTGGTQSLTFSESIENLAFSVVSMNGGDFEFNQDFDIVSYTGLNGASAGYFGGGNMIKTTTSEGTFKLTDGGTNTSSDTGTHSEPHGTLRFANSFSELTWIDVDETWHGFTVGVSGASADAGKVQFNYKVGNTAKLGDIDINGAMETTAEIKSANSLDVSGFSKIGGDITTSVSQNFQSAVTLTDNTTLTTTNNGNVTTNATIDGAYNLDINTDGTGDTSIGGAIGASTALKNVTISTDTVSINGINVEDNSAVEISNESESTISDIISGTGVTFTKDGTGTLILSGTNTYTGSTTIDDGTLQLGNGSNTGWVSSTSIVNNSNLVYNRSNETQYGGIISGTGNLEKKGTGTLILTKDNTYTGSTTITEGTLQLGNGGTEGSISNTSNVINNGTLKYNKASDSVANYLISGSGNVEIIGTSSLLFGDADNTNNIGFITTTPQTIATNTTVQDVLEKLAGGRMNGQAIGGILEAGVYNKDFTDGTFQVMMYSNGGAGNQWTKVVFVKLEQDGTNVTAKAYEGRPNTNPGKYAVYASGDVRGVDYRTANITGTMPLATTGNFDDQDNSPGYGVDQLFTSSKITFTKDNTYTGTTTLNTTVFSNDGSGTSVQGSYYERKALAILQLGQNGTSGNIEDSSSILNNGVLIYDRSDDLTTTGDISGSGKITKLNSNTVTLSGLHSYTGSTLIDDGTLKIQNDAATTASSIFDGDGKLIIESASDSFSSSFSSLGWTLANTITGLTIGKSTNTTDITIANAIDIDGFINIYGGDITINSNLDTQGGTTSGDILLKASRDITQAASKTVTTDGGDVIYWSNTDNGTNSDGGIFLRNGSSITTSGGHAWFGGGLGTTTWNSLTVGDGYALSGTEIDVINNLAHARAGIYLENSSINTSGGDISIAGKGTSDSHYGIVNLGTTTINSGSGHILIDGVANSGTGNTFGIVTGFHNTYVNANLTITSSSDDLVNDAIVIKASGLGTQARGMIVEGNTVVSATESGAISIESTASTSGVGIDLGYSTTSTGVLDVLAKSGDITFNTKDSGISIATVGSINMGRKTGSTVTTSSSDITLIADNFTSNGPLNFNTSGILTIKPQDGNSFTSTFDTSNLTYSSDVSGLTIGHSSNTGDITVGSSTTIAGDISLYGGDITINNKLEATSSTITLDGSGTVSDGVSGYVVATNLLLSDGAVTLDNMNNDVDNIAGTALDSLTFYDTDGITIGSTIGSTSGISSSGNVILSTGADESVGTTTGGDIIISGTPTVTSSTGNVKLYTGSITGSTGLTTLVGSGSGNFRYNSDETNTNFTTALGTTGTYAIYREQPSVSGTISSETITYGDANPSFTMSGGSGLVNGDSSSGFTIVGSSNSSAGKLVADEYDVSASGLSALGYSVSSVTNGKLTVNKKSLSVTGLTASSKTYNADNTAILSNAGTLNGKVTGDTVTFTTASTFNNANVEATKTLNLDFTLGGTDKDNYSLLDASDVTTSALINAKELTLSASKTYDGTTSLTGDVTLAGYVGSETLTYSNATVNDSHVATADKYINAITLENATDSSGGIATNYKLPILNNTNAPVTINAATLTPTISNTSVTKTYDATTNASSGFTPTYNFVGLISGDTDVNLSYTSANYDDKDVSNASKITLAGLSINNITGTNSSNASDYILDSTSKDVSASITKANLTVSANDDARFVTQSDTSGFAGVTYSGFVSDEDVTDITASSLTISRIDVSTDTTAGIYTDKLVASGLSSANYSFTYENGDYTIVPSNQLLVKVTNVNNNYGTATQYAISSVEYANGSTVYRLDNGSITNSSTSINANNEVTITDGSGGSATFTVAPQNQSTSTAGKLEVGSYQLGIVGIVTENSENFGDTLTLIGSHQVNKKSLTASADDGISKIYDGTTAMNGVSLSLSTLESNSGTDDIVIASGVGAFTNKNVSTTAGYTISNVALSGTDSSNYYLSAGTSFTGSNGVITAKELILDYTAANKVYDGDTIASVSSTDNIIYGDDVVISQTANFSDKNVADGKTVSIVTTLSGSDKDNYVLSTPNTSKTANITRLNSVTWIGGGIGDWFDPSNWAGGAVPDLSNVANVIIPTGTVVSFDTSGVVNPADASSAVNIDSLGTLGSLTMANGELNIQNSMTLDTFTQNGGILTAGSITTNTYNQTAGSSTSTSLTTDVLSQSGGTTTTDNLTVNESFTQSGTTGQITVNNNANITQTNGNMQIGNLDVGGDLTANANNGNIVQVNGTTIDVSGLTTLNASEDITLDSITNNFTTLALNAVNAAIVDGVGGIILDDITTSGNLDVKSLGGDITQNENSSIKAKGTSSFDSGSNDIILGNNTNEFDGKVNLKGNSATIGGKTRPTIGSQNLRNGLIITNEVTAFVKNPELKPINQKPINPNADAPVNDNIEVDASATNNTTNNAKTNTKSNELSTQASTTNTQDTNVVEQNNTKMSFDGIVVGTTQTGSDVKAIIVQGSSSSNTPVTMLVKVKAQEGLNFTVPKSIVSQVTKTVQAPAKVIGATLSDGKELPSWISFDITTSSFTSANVPSNGLPLSVKVMTSNGKSIEVVLNK
ncbi:MAG: YDG domain-containing protein [Poseidonibacter sp.]